MHLTGRPGSQHDMQLIYLEQLRNAEVWSGQFKLRFSPGWIHSWLALLKASQLLHRTQLFWLLNIGLQVEFDYHWFDIELRHPSWGPTGGPYKIWCLNKAPWMIFEHLQSTATNPSDWQQNQESTMSCSKFNSLWQPVHCRIYAKLKKQSQCLAGFQAHVNCTSTLGSSTTNEMLTLHKAVVRQTCYQPCLKAHFVYAAQGV